MSIGNKNKSDLNLYCQKSRIAIATYTSSTQDGQFISKVNVNGTEYSSTSGYSTKKEAENDAAGVALIAVLQKEFGGKSIEEALAILEQKHPSKNKKKSKQASSNVSMAQSGTQVHHRDAGNTQVQTDSSRSGQIDSSTAQHGGVTRTPQMPPPQQLQQQEPSGESHVVQKQSQIHSGGPQSGIVRPMPAHSGAVMGQYQTAAAYSYQQTVVRPRSPGVLLQSETMSQAPQQRHQQAMVRPNQPYVVDSHSQQTVVHVQDNRTDSDIAWSQGVMMVTPKGGGRGGAREQDQRTQGQPSPSSANVVHPATGSGGQTPPTHSQAYAPHTAGPYYYPMQRYPPANTAAYGQYYAPPYMQPAYMHQAPPTSGHHWRHPPHPHLISSTPPGAYPSSTSGQQTVMPTGVKVATAPPPGARSMAARFPGTAPSPPPPSSSSQQLQPIVPPSQGSLPPPPGFSADQSAASPGQTAPNKPLNAIRVSKLTGQGLPSSTTGDRQYAKSASQKDVSKNLDLHHTKQLEELCKNRNLPAPQYRINEEKRKYFAEVIIGHQSFRTQWPCENMEQAKCVAAMEAMVKLTMSMSALSTGDTGNQQESESSRSSTASSSQANPSTSLITTSPSALPSQTAEGQSSSAHTQQDQSLKQQQTLSSTQQPLPSPSNTVTAVTNNPPPALQPPSFFTNNNNPPNPPTNTTATSTTQAQAKPIKEEIQPSPQPQSPASSKAKAMAVNYKQILNTHCQRNHIAHVYDCVASEDAVGYVATVKVSGQIFTSKNHGTKRAAETDAAGVAVKALGLVGPQGDYQPQQGQGKTGSGYYGVTQPSLVSQPQGMVSYKNLLQEHVQKQGLTLPHYETERVEEGFKSTVKVHRHGNESLTFTSSPQPVKKGAEQEAAKAACLELNLIH